MADFDFDLSGLEQLDKAGLSKGAAATGQPLEVSIDDVIEDPNQPRTEANPGFSAESIAEIGESILSDKVRQPIIVRPKNADGKYMIWDGARRYRGSKWAKKKTIPIIIDPDFDRVAQLMVNLQKEGNTPDEIAHHISELENEGMSRVEIAKRLGKGKSFVTDHMKFAAAEAYIRSLYDQGTCKDMTILIQLNDLYKSHPEQVKAFVDSGKAINRPSFAEFSKQVKNPQPSASQTTDIQAGGQPNSAGSGGEPAVNPDSANQQNNGQGSAGEKTVTTETTKATTTVDSGNSAKADLTGAGGDETGSDKGKDAQQDGGAAKPSKEVRKVETPKADNTAHQVPQIHAKYEGEAVTILLTKKAEANHCWVQYSDGVSEIAPCADVVLVDIAFA